MKARSAAIQGALAAAGLVAAYVTWQRPPETQKKESVIIADANKNSLERVSYSDGTRVVTVEKKDRFYVTLAYLPGKRPEYDAGSPMDELDAGTLPDGGVMPKRPPPPPPVPDRTVYANERAEQLWTKLTPFEGTRALGAISTEKLSELGLEGSPRRLELTISGAPVSFVINKQVAGLAGSYAQNEKTKDVFLVSNQLFNELDPNSTVLVDRRLHTFKLTEFDAFTVSSGGKTASYVASGADIPATMRIAPAATPDKPDELTKNWHDKIWSRLVVTEVLSKDEPPRNGAPEVVLRLEYSLKGKPVGWLELANDEKQAWWARSENTASWVALHSGTQDIALEGSKLAQGTAP